LTSKQLFEKMFTMVNMLANEILLTIQVCWELNNRTEKRELAGLTEAGGRAIAFVPVWKWLLEK
jgi:hypothetical protein